VLGSTISDHAPHTLHVQLAGLPAGSRVALISDTTAGQAWPIPLGAAGDAGAFTASRTVLPPLAGEAWYFAVVCPPEVGLACGTDQRYSAVTAPIWLS
jgi:hypothetical protein